jgi:predicted RNA-binding protein YlqC (UPF0109 family)
VKKLIEYLVTSLVDSPSEVLVEEVEDGSCLQYKIRVSKADLGKVIGKRGRTAKAMRLLVSTFAAEKGKEISLEIIEPPEAKVDETVTT